MIYKQVCYSPSWFGWLRDKRKGYLFRYDAVPGVHVRHYGSYFRYPQTHNERKNRVIDKELKKELQEFGVYIKEGDRYLPNSWDDIHKWSLHDKNWKNFGKKKKQWEKGSR